MKKVLGIICVLTFLILGCVQKSTEQSKDFRSGWELVFRSGKKGETLFGSKAKLIEAVRSGYSVRVGWGGRRQSDTTKSVEHVADAQFLTIANSNEVFAQIQPIIGQNPGLEKDTLDMVFRENLQWTLMVGTNGFSDRLTTERLQDTIQGHRSRPTEVSWFVEYPVKSKTKGPIPLWAK
ncbi:hypothetical protein FEE95_15090 [Maribacter algarum]|uniref:Lipoprotein n=1 Tax=Maribacter algarum (ex Zhang et al. 2020) TaxID=2578118 RepID=A0A5S3PNG3_9FLAO|nr:hypothetical protein [Maribacter algarum]TMM55966.1 hypothetical protein FEE95_15090 [Maribacter algarum]